MSASVGRAGHHVLVVDDDDDARAGMARAVRRAGVPCITARSGEEALAIVRRRGASIAVIVLDVQLAGMTGYEVVRRLNATGGGASVLLVSGALRRDSDVLRGLKLGAVDFVLKPTLPAVLVAKVRAALCRFVREQELVSALGAAREQATIDTLTRVHNRRAFEVHLAEACAQAARGREALSLLIVDIDHFKAINDRFGHVFGDEALAHFAAVLRGAVRSSDRVFRYGGEEFTCLLPDCGAPSARATWERLRDTLAAVPLTAPDRSRVDLRASAGLAVADPGTGYDRGELVAAADAALYVAKRGGRDRLQIAV